MRLALDLDGKGYIKTLIFTRRFILICSMLVQTHFEEYDLKGSRDPAQLWIMHRQITERLNNFPQRDGLSNQKDHILMCKIEIEKIMVSQEQPEHKSGRGGNNIAQNIKKSVLAIVKKALSAELYRQISQRLIEPYNVKSQKENIIIFFLFLHVLVHERKIRKKDIEILIKQVHDKINKYISNSEKKMRIQEYRHDFHAKNIIEFRKFQQIDLDFSKQRSFRQMMAEVQKFYIRKKMECQKAEDRLKRFINNHPCLLQCFIDSKEIQKDAPASEPSPSNSEQSLSPLNALSSLSHSSNQIFEDE